MKTGFFGKVMLSILAGFGCACLIYFYKEVVIGADEALNKGYDHRGLSGSGKQ